VIAFDTNILIYSVSFKDSLDRHVRSIELVRQVAPTGGIVPLQVIGEFLNVCRQKKMVEPRRAAKRASEFMEGFDCPQTTPEDLIKAFNLADRKMLQYFDSLIITVARRAGATILLSEDMQDGLDVDGLRVVNPFLAGNEALLADYFAEIMP
jgi:predicted nucleic acid-binding protein